ncbi:Dynein assembly factor 1, axonemal [Gossypium arboreum]|uniref:Dynein assembly factor 1, axonemal n=1 Tax=Gossypium arboreum TaxID=29729 RepID=A0A0B0N2D7_GOSAR|nr:Dynein assembly factor 1, axonemal [Gossypium arboreum]
MEIFSLDVDPSSEVIPMASPWINVDTAMTHGRVVYPCASHGHVDCPCGVALEKRYGGGGKSIREWHRCVESLEALILKQTGRVCTEVGRLYGVALSFACESYWKFPTETSGQLIALSPPSQSMSQDGMNVVKCWREGSRLRATYVIGDRAHRKYRGGSEQGEQAGPAPKWPSQYIGPLPIVILVEAETGHPMGWRRIEAVGEHRRIKGTRNGPKMEKMSQRMKSTRPGPPHTGRPHGRVNLAESKHDSHKWTTPPCHSNRLDHGLK